MAVFSGVGEVHRAYDSLLRERGLVAEQVWIAECGLVIMLSPDIPIHTMSAEEFDAGQMLAPFSVGMKACAECFGIRV